VLIGCLGKVPATTRPSHDNDIIAVGYGSTPRSRATGAIASLNREQIDSGPQAQTLADLLERIPGVSVTGHAGSRSVRVRSGTGDPLFVVDGAPRFAGATLLEILLGSDIERIDVLKDAGATATYGMRGTNGVVLITTRLAR
jgi:TonB-dependent SusC/RagA subfamily outer membrane receptor